MPQPSTPTLLLMVVRFFTPLRTRARIRFSGMPHRPNPPTIMVAPSKTSRIDSSAFATTLVIFLIQIYHGGAQPKTAHLGADRFLTSEKISSIDARARTPFLTLACPDSRASVPA